MILIIDHFDSFSHNLYQSLAAHGDEVLVRRCDEIKIEKIQALQPNLIVLSPGPRGPMETGITLSLLDSDWGKQQAILGICLGFQAMVMNWGGTVERASEVVHGKTIHLKTLDHPIFEGCANPLQVARYHSLCAPVQKLPKYVQVLAQHGNMAMATHDTTHRWIGLQFHPESFLTPQGSLLLQNIKHFLNPKP